MHFVLLDWIVAIVLVLFIFILILFSISIIVQTLKYRHLSKLIINKDSKQYFKVIDIYIEKAKSESQKNNRKLAKLRGMCRLGEWSGIEDVVNSISFNKSIFFILLFTNAILDLYILDKIDLANIMVAKAENQTERIKNNFRIKFCIAIRDYFNNDLQKSKKAFNELLKINIKNKYFIANINYYLGLIAKQENDLVKCKTYFESVILFPQKCLLVDKANKMIDEINGNTKENPNQAANSY